VNVNPVVEVTDATDESSVLAPLDTDTNSATSELAAGVKDADVAVLEVVDPNSVPETGVFSAT